MDAKKQIEFNFQQTLKHLREGRNILWTEAGNSLKFDDQLSELMDIKFKLEKDLKRIMKEINAKK